MKSKAFQAALEAVAEAEDDSAEDGMEQQRSGEERRSGNDRRAGENSENMGVAGGMDAPEVMEASAIIETQGVEGQLQAALEVKREARAAQKSAVAPKPGAGFDTTQSASKALQDGNWMNYVFTNEPTINDNELISLCALIAYVAHVTGQSDFRIERRFSDRFNIPNVKCLPMDRYDDAVRYLVDQVPLFAA